MKKKIQVFITAFIFALGILCPGMEVHAETGKTSLSVSSSSVNIGDTVTVTGKVTDSSGGSAVATMVLSYDAGVLEYVSCTTTCGGGGGSISVTGDSFTATFKAIAAGTSSLSMTASDGVVFASGEEMDSVAGSSSSVTVNNAASTNNNTGTANSGNSSAGGSQNGTDTTTKLSADNSLKSLVISPGTLSPAFSGSTTKYTASVDNDVTNIAVSATPANGKATVESVSGNTNLSVGTNQISIVVKAEDGTTATYKITVTRLGAGETTSSETQEETEETETQVSESEETIIVNSMNYRISENFGEEAAPEDFSEQTVNYHDAQYRGLSYNNGSVTLLYPVTEGEETAGRFFVYDETRDVFYDFAKLACGDSYVIALLPPVDTEMPEGYSQTTVTLADGTMITAYEEQSEEGENIEFYLFYAVNSEGTEGWYRYDSVEGTYQRFTEEITDTEEDSDMTYLQQSYNTLSEKYKKEKAFARNTIAALVFALVIALIVIFNMILFHFHKKKQQDEDEIEDEEGIENEEEPEDGEEAGTPEPVNEERKKKRHFVWPTLEEGQDSLEESEPEELQKGKTPEKEQEEVIEEEPAKEKKSSSSSRIEVEDLNDL